MSDMEQVFNKTSQTLLNLAKTLNPEFKDKVLDSLLTKESTRNKTFKKNKSNGRFCSHPDRISSGSELSVIKSGKNGFCDDLASFHYNKFFNNNITPSGSSISTNGFGRSTKPIIRSPVLSCYSDTQTALISKEEVAERSRELVKAVTQFKAKQVKRNQDNVLSKPGINGVKSKPSVNKANITTTFVKPLIITTTCKTSMPIDIDKKLRLLIQKSLGLLEEIRIAMSVGVPPPDGIEELERMTRRTVEFVSRYGRMYVYSLDRQIADLEKHTKCSSKIAHRSIMNIHQSLLGAHQSIINAFQIYRNNMLTCIPSMVIEKLIQVLNKSLYICAIHKKCLNLETIGCNQREESIDVLISECNLLLLTIQQNMENAIRYQSNKPQLKSRTRFSLRGYRGGRKEIRNRKPKKILSRLSMYSAPGAGKRRDGSWSQTFDTMSKDHYKYGHVHSRYLTAGYKHRPPLVNTAHADKPPFISVPMKTKGFQKKMPGYWRRTPLATARNEDEIQTIVETQKENIDDVDQNSCSEKSKTNLKENSASCEKSSANGLRETPRDCDTEKSNREKKLHELSPYIYELCEQVIASENEAMSQKHLEGLLKGLLGMALNEKIDDRESGSKKNGSVARSNCHNTQSVQGQNLQSSSLNLEKKDANANKIVANNNVRSTRSDESLDERNGKKLNKYCNTELSPCTTVPQKSDIIKSIEENQTANGLLEYVQCCDDKCKKVNFDENLSKKKKIVDAGQANKKKRRQTITVTGAKNAQLICIKDEDSIVENNGRTKPIKCDRNNNISLTKTKDSGGKAAKANSKLSRVPKRELKQLAFISKKEALNVIQYKLQYSEYVKGNAMYRKSSSKQPWVIVNSLSEHLLNNVLLSIAKEIQVDDILKRLYESEFQ